MTDAAHLLSDVAGMAISISAITLARQQSNKAYTFGYHRAEVLGALLSVLLIWALTAILVYEAILRMITPEQVKGELMFFIAVAGLFINIAMLCVLGGHGHSHGGAECSGHGDEENINVRAAVVHIIGDFVQTIGVIIAAVLIWISPAEESIGYRLDSNGNKISNWCLADPVCTCVFAILVLMTTWGIVKESVNVLMLRTPEGVKLSDFLKELRQVKDVVEVHDVHLWAVSPGKNCIACHIRVDHSAGDNCSDDDVLSAAQLLASKKYKIWHCTFQIEHTECAPHGLGCAQEKEAEDIAMKSSPAPKGR
jgi:cation diffusion facilitator family transporter